MKQAIQKIRSKTGASITFALLLFLVCAVLGSVVLAAGTAASGRLSEMTEMDQRYYSVTSAADLFCDTLCERQITVVRQRTTGYTQTTTFRKVGDTVTQQGLPSDSQTSQSFQATINDSTNYGASGDLLVVAAQKLVHIGSDGSWDAPSPVLTEDEVTQLELAVDPGTSGMETAALSVSVEQTLKENGDLVFVLKNSDGDPFCVRVTLFAEIKEDPAALKKTTLGSTVTSALTPVAGETDTFTYTVSQDRTETETITTRIIWHVKEVKTMEEEVTAP